MSLTKVKAGLVIAIAILTLTTTSIQLGFSPNSGKKISNQESNLKYQLNSIEYRLRSEIRQAKRILETDTNLLLREKVTLKTKHIKSLINYSNQYQEVLRVTDEYVESSLNITKSSIEAWEGYSLENKIDKKTLDSLKTNLREFETWLGQYVKTKKSNEKNIAGLLTFLNTDKTNSLTAEEQIKISSLQIEAIIGSPTTIAQMSTALDKLLLPNKIVKLTETMLSQYGTLVTTYNKHRAVQEKLKQTLLSWLLIIVSIMAILAGIVEFMIVKRAEQEKSTEKINKRRRNILTLLLKKR